MGNTEICRCNLYITLASTFLTNQNVMIKRHFTLAFGKDNALYIKGKTTERKINTEDSESCRYEEALNTLQ